MPCWSRDGDDEGVQLLLFVMIRLMITKEYSVIYCTYELITGFAA